MNCSQCGTKNPDDFVFCLQCGQRLGAPSPGSDTSQQQVAELSAQTIAEASPLLEAFDEGGIVAKLQVQQGSVDQREFDLGKPVVSIGRRLGNDIVIHDTNVSREHARILRQGDGFVLEDCESANGTLLNEQPVAGSHPLADGDVIQVGEAVFVYHFDRAIATPEAGATMAMDLDSPLTRLGSPLSIDPPAELISPAAAPAGPLTPPPAIMESTRMTLDDEPSDEQSSASAGPSTPTTPPPAVEPPSPPQAVGSTSTDPLSAVRADLSDLKRDLLSFVESLDGLADRVDRLDSALTEAGSQHAELVAAARGEAAQPLRDVAPLLEEVRASGSPEQLQPIIDLLDQLASQPRDIELLLKLSQQADKLEVLLRLHLRLVAAAPEVREALERVIR